MRKPITLVVVSVLLVTPVAVGIVAADTASIKSVTIVDKVDRNNNGQYSSFSIRIEADTSCVGCNDEGDDNIEANFDIVIIDENDNEARHEGEPKFDVKNDNNLVKTYDLTEYLDGYPAGERLTIRVELWDDDLITHDKIDTKSASVVYEPSSVDTPKPTPTPTPTATPTPTPTATPTPTPTATPTPTPTPERTTDGSSQEGIQDSDDDGVIDSKDYAPNDPEVQEKSDLQGSAGGVTIPGFGFEVALVAVLIAGLIALRRS